jgi:predicted aldo/keto reductase-like oxidoreductase
MGDAATLQANCDAACAPGLTSSERESLSFHARATSASYCAGCASLCESRIAGTAPISEVMRLMMYAYGYRDLERARTAFAALPAARRQAIAMTDYAAAERACPQGIEIAKVMRQASSLLA